MSKMNNEVETEQREPKEVAYDFLQEKKLLKETDDE